MDGLNLRGAEQVEKTLSMLSRLAYIATAHDTGHCSVPLAQVKTLLVVRNGRLEAGLVPEDPLR